jgi:hypothetical protein
VRTQATADQDEVSVFDPETNLTRLTTFNAGFPGRSQYEKDRQGRAPRVL